MSDASGENQDRWWMSRRAFLSSGAAAGFATAALGGVAAERAEAHPTNDIDAMVLQMAAAIAVFPIRFETHESEPASARLTTQRVALAWARCSAPRAERAQRGARLLIDRELGGVETEALLEQLGMLAAKGSADHVDDVKALAAVAGATLADRIDPEGDLAPTLWLGGLANMHKNGVRPAVEATP